MRKGLQGLIGHGHLHHEKAALNFGRAEACSPWDFGRPGVSPLPPHTRFLFLEA
jgi:hypothetical protein